MMPAKCYAVFSHPDQPAKHYEHALPPMAAYIAASTLIKNTKHCSDEYLAWLRTRAFGELELLKNQSQDSPDIDTEELSVRLVADAICLVLPEITKEKTKYD